ncbi:hypothetical protein BsIDN1_28020 [Bacillus safensis]|uniref:Uncharacterized protein n=1 Tax=Bacillus safensis TaxID=561879 RepID=A0A5S9MAK6_BACIA|nr:hypothetical protein BsIDN1_28020 [Bacillus safensis]
MKNIPGLSGIDTRKLTRMIRSAGTLRGAFAGPDEQVEDVVRRLQTLQLPTDQVSQVSVKNAYPSPGREKELSLSISA